MTDGIDEEVLERLEAEAKVADADAEELTIAVESEIEQKETEVEELQEEVEEKEAEVEELQNLVESKDEEIETMKEDLDEVSERYAEELAQDSDVLDAEDFKERFDFEELQEKYEALMESSSEPSPDSGDPGAGFQSPEGGEGEETNESNLTEKEELAAEAFRQRAKKSGNEYWNDIADEIEQEGSE
jgi:exonuclease SbcC